MKSGAMRVSLVVLGLLLLFFSLPVQAESTPATFEGPGFASPEEAVTGYLNALREADVDGILQSFAIESYVDHFDFAAQLERLGIYMQMSDPALPASHAYARRLNIYRRLGTISQAVANQYFGLFLSEHEINGTLVRSLDSKNGVADFVDLLGDATYLDDLATLEVGELLGLSSFSKELNSGLVQKQLAEMAAIYGANRVVGLAVEVRIAESDLLLLFETGQYAGGWYIIHLGGLLAAILDVPAMNGGVWLD